jgi:hypothetical protein
VADPDISGAPITFTTNIDLKIAPDYSGVALSTAPVIVVGQRVDHVMSVQPRGG